MNRRNFLKGLFATVSAPALRLPSLSVSAFETMVVDQHLTRSAIWSRQVKEILFDELNAMKFTNILD